MTVHPYDPAEDPDVGPQDPEVEPGTEPPKPDHEEDDYADVDALLDDEEGDDG